MTKFIVRCVRNHVISCAWPSIHLLSVGTSKFNYSCSKEKQYARSTFNYFTQYWIQLPFPCFSRFWDLLCSSCGNQNTNEKVKVFSVRRSINSWSDIAHLLISCLSVTSPQRMFDLESEMISFLDSNIDRLHLPRQVYIQPISPRFPIN